MEHYSLSQFNTLVKQTIQRSLDPSYWIVCEIGELNLHRNGHCYLELVEKEGNKVLAKLRATIWSYTYASIHRLFHRITGSDLSAGMQVLVNASLEFHPIYGLSLNIKDIDPNYTLGERERKRQATIQQLVDDGVMDLNKSLVLPMVPQRIAIISAEGAAGYGDFMNQITQNPYGYIIDTRLFHATMQGDTAAQSILSQLHRIYELEDAFDLVILIRGGGAKMDLDCFDDYELNAHLAQFPLPIITGIGHERDETIADLVANISLKTPTAVAEFLISGFMDFESKINTAFEQIKNMTNQRINQEVLKTQHIAQRIEQQSRLIITQEQHKLERSLTALTNRPTEIINQERTKISLTAKLIDAQDPQAILNRGFSISRLNGKSLTNQKVKEGDVLITQTANQTITSKVEKS